MAAMGEGKEGRCRDCCKLVTLERTIDASSSSSFKNGETHNLRLSRQASVRSSACRFARETARDQPKPIWVMNWIHLSYLTSFDASL